APAVRAHAVAAVVDRAARRKVAETVLRGAVSVPRIVTAGLAIVLGLDGLAVGQARGARAVAVLSAPEAALEASGAAERERVEAVQAALDEVRRHPAVHLAALAVVEARGALGLADEGAAVVVHVAGAAAAIPRPRAGAALSVGEAGRS